MLKKQKLNIEENVEIMQKYIKEAINSNWTGTGSHI